MESKDSAGNILNDGDTIIVDKILKVRGYQNSKER